MKPIRFHPEAEAEMIDAAQWYERQQTNLGKRFLSTIQDSLNRIEFNPLLFPLIEGDVRRCLSKSFPFAVLFRIRPDFIAVVAVMHLRRDPDYWKNREAA
ncbi:MAG: type II toxin-antitoxin system RelE/ParE family toxin [Kiritimatiellales bacterium]|nr:type II toxin-antitoxin system RelE/ParE family toxin [Kiritimatiellota bacterium]MBL7011444.1 type II toxin-antitoxin system RelE/ParE family toxin [Kiritimatiellales bacterium]